MITEISVTLFNAKEDSSDEGEMMNAKQKKKKHLIVQLTIEKLFDGQDMFIKNT